MYININNNIISVKSKSMEFRNDVRGGTTCTVYFIYVQNKQNSIDIGRHKNQAMAKANGSPITVRNQ